MKWVAALAGLFLTGCAAGPTSGSHPPASPTNNANSPSGSASPARTTSPTASAASPIPLAALPLGIVVKDFLVEGGATYTVSLVGLDGRVDATATGAKRSRPAGIYVQMPNVSASDSRVYYLDGDSKVMFLRPDGTTGPATTIPVDSNSTAVFAVSPDDTRIAVAIITFPFPAKTRIYVENLTDGGNHIELFSSGTVIEWPVGWHQGHLVIGLGINVQPQNAYEGFVYAGPGYHVADPATGTRISTVCDGYEASGPPVPAGTVCVNYPKFEVSDWSGATRPAPSGACGGGALSPDGAEIASCQSGGVALVARNGTTITTPYYATDLGWMDATHVVIHLVTHLDADSSLSVLDIHSMAVTPFQTHGFFAGVIPGGL
jgi:hypothetical protein